MALSYKDKSEKRKTTLTSLVKKKGEVCFILSTQSFLCFSQLTVGKRVSAPHTLSSSRLPPSAGNYSLIGSVVKRHSFWRFLLAVGCVNHRTDSIHSVMTIDSAFFALRGIQCKRQQSPWWWRGKQVGSAKRIRNVSEDSPASAFYCDSLRNSPYTDTHSTFSSLVSAPPCSTDPSEDRVCLTGGLTP